MKSLMRAFSGNFHRRAVKGSSKVFIIFSFLFFPLVDTLAEPPEDTINPLTNESEYMNYAQKGSYENETWFSEVPEWHYYDMFGNKLLDGFYLYGLSMDRNTISDGASHVALHPFLKKWLNGLVQVADLQDNGGILAMMGDRVKSEFTPFTLKQTLFAGSRIDVFYKKNSLSFLTNRISNAGSYGMVTDQSTATDNADWLTGGHAMRGFGDVAVLGGTYVNIHHEESDSSSNPFSGTPTDASGITDPTGLSLYGLDANITLTKLKAYCEYAKSQEFIHGDFTPKSGTVATLNARYDIFEKWQCGGEFYTIGSRFQTDFTCPVHKNGDVFGAGKYQYSLIEDNDDKDDYPENGQTRYPYFPIGDPDGVIPVAYDKDKNGIWDYKEAFLGYDADPPESKILFDRNTNGIPDQMENDPYPDYSYVPSYYLPGERYWRYDDVDKKWENKTADSMTHKGLAGVHIYSRYDIFPNLELTLGGIFDKSQEKTFQATYVQGMENSEVYASENATNLYFLTHYKRDIGRDKYVYVDNFCRRVQDNIPNHTQDFYIKSESVHYYLVPDKLEYRDVFAEALRAEFTLFRNRGLNYTSAGKFEFQKHFPHLEFNYPNENISSFILINKCEYIYLLPFFKDLFLIPKYKNVYELKDYGPNTSDSLDVVYQRNSMVNAADLVCEWKLTEKSAFTTGLQFKRFNDFIDTRENYIQPCFGMQLMVKDRYTGLAVILTLGFTRYAYIYDHSGRQHDPLNNPHRAVDNIDAHELFIKVHCGF